MTHPSGSVHARAVGLALLLAAGLAPLSGCSDSEAAEHPAPQATARQQTLRELPGVGERWRAQIPSDTRQAIIVYGKGTASADSTVALYRKTADGWKRERQWSAHNGRRGWTPSHQQGDKKSPTGVFTLSDAGGVLPDPGAKLPYHASSAFTPPTYWPKSTRHDFDYVIAIDYNRVRGSSPIDPRRPEGESRGGGIWLHLDHGSGTSACVSLSKAGMRHLLRTIDPALHPVIVMGDRASLGA